MTKNAYIHIPFCRSKCNYCSFTSYCNLELIDNYIEALLQDIKFNYQGEYLNTLYIGGGTPSLLNPRMIEKILTKFNLTLNCEITIELNPDSVDYEYLKDLKSLAINRLSFGCQTFDDEILKLIARRHDSKMAVKSFNWAKEAGFENINFDFIYGLPQQTISGFLSDLNRAAKLGVKHISLYGLKIDEGCYFYKKYPENIANDDVQADMYLGANDVMEKFGFKHYEISNYAQKGYESRHNLNYWNNNTYYGFGCAAHGYVDGKRYSNCTDLEKYINNPLEKEFIHEVTVREQLEEEIFLGFRKSSGIDCGKIKTKFGIDFDVKFQKQLDKYISARLIERTNQGYILNPKGMLLSNQILADFL